MGERPQPLVAMYVDTAYADEYGYTSFEELAEYAERMGYAVDALAYASAVRESRADPRRLEKSVAAIEALRRRAGGDRSLVVRWHFGILGWGVLPPFRRADLLADYLAREGKVVRMVARAGDFFLIVTGGADPWSLRRHYVGLIGKEDAVKLARLLAEAGQEDRTNLSEGRTKKVMKILNNVVGFFGEEAGDD